ncbi:hypothetical protein HU200_050510 [Digitaria exilis]|uniref:Uncharacterized protein n=1 Tax=Digitaria exilis TaxID=1010633 RepID=A0A835E7G0_9POAL|nr:hypothetical protein HU200_050510 [Digitaria exilis]
MTSTLLVEEMVSQCSSQVPWRPLSKY